MQFTSRRRLLQFSGVSALTAASGGVIASVPGSITINSPEMARRRNHVTSYLRYETTFPKRIQELAIITTARAMGLETNDFAILFQALARMSGLSG